jgi:hypothetical protein
MMRKLKTMILALFTAWEVYAADITPITEAMKSGNTGALSGSMYTEADVSVPGVSQRASAAEAAAILGRFFQGNPPTGFTVVHQADKNGGGFVVGKLQTASREYRVNITYVLKDGRALMQTIRIE